MQNENVRKKNFKSKLVRRSLLAASTVFVIGVTTVGAHSQDYFSSLFHNGGTSLVENHTAIQEAKVVSGIKMKVVESIIGGKSASILVSFEKEDGTPFSGDVKASSPELDWKQNASYMVNQQMTEDDKKLVVLFDIDTTKNLNGKSMTIMAGNLVDQKTDKIVAEGPFTISFVASETSTSKNIEIDLDITDSTEKLALHHLNISANGIGIEGARLDGMTDVLPKHKPELTVTTLDNKTFELEVGSTSTTKSGFKWQYNVSENGERIYLNEENIKSVSINDHLIEVIKRIRARF